MSWPVPDNVNDAVLWRFSGRILLSMVMASSKLWMTCLNTVKVHNRETLVKLVDEKKKALITCSNHTCCMDDPLQWVALRLRQIFYWPRMRWNPSAIEITHSNRMHSWFFTRGKCVPIVRGHGVYQRCMDFLLQRLNQGDWIHIFPEGRVNVCGDVGQRLKWGIGRLVAECELEPTVLPIWLVGMERVLPNQEPYIPRVGQNVTILVGRPLEFRQVRQDFREKCIITQVEARKQITDAVQAEFARLREQARRLHKEHFGEDPDQLKLI